jgi:ABC-type antimicrobial peptide transport system permease subunit
VAEDIRRVLPAGFQVAAPAQRTADLHRVMQSFQTFLQGVALVGLIAAFLITFNRLATVFDGRTWQMGVMRAVGMSTSVLWRELLKESLLIGAAGVALGIPLGFALGYLLLPVIASTTATNYELINPDAGLGIGSSAPSVWRRAWFCRRTPCRAVTSRAPQASLAEVIRTRGLDRPAP